MKIEFWGAAGTVTGSMHLIEVNGHRLLLDGGLYQGRRKEAFKRNRDIPFDAAQIDAAILSHAHIDHSGNLPSLVRAGFRGSIYATAATRDMATILLLDSAHIQEQDVRYVNRKRAKKGQNPFEPLYEVRDAVRTLEQFVSIEKYRTFSPIPGVQAHFIGAGHMLGAATVVLDLEEGETRKRLVFSGDIGRDSMPILKDPEIASDAHYVIMESTYGQREHESSTDASESLLEEAQRALRLGGKLIIPSFAVGRTQEVVYKLNLLRESGRLPEIPVYVDSPLAVNATEIYRLHPECFDDDMQDAIDTEEDGDPLRFSHLRYIKKAQDSKRLNDLKGPAIIISASGMCEAGRILHHLKNNISDPKNAVLFVGYQAPHTLGRKIREGMKEVNIFGSRYQVKARIASLESCSAHADRIQLIEWAEETCKKGQVEKVFFVHGEDDARDALEQVLAPKIGSTRIEKPQRGQSFPLS